jgi:glycosyltransferase involved in cell wall biosynthesis
MKTHFVSLVVPLYNEEANVAKLYYELASVVDAMKQRAEFVFVDDGSTDKTVENLVAAAENDSRVRVVSFRRNFGQTAAMAAGFDYAQGDIIVTLDGDLQHAPAEIPTLLAKLDEGFDLVAGWRKNRQDAAISRKLPSFIANRIISRTTSVSLHDYGCTLKAMKAEVAKNLAMYGEMHRFIPALAAEHGVKIAEIPVNHRPRVAGKSKYGISRTFRVLLDLLTVKFFLGFSTRPLHMFGALGFLSSGIGTALMVLMVIERMFFSVPMGNRPLLMLAALLILIGLQFICFGLLAEILVRTYHESQNKKIYTVRKVVTLGAGRGEERVRVEEPELRRAARAL